MARHHVGPECPGCAEKLEQVHPRLKEWFLCVVKPAHPDAHISWGWRGQADQDRFYAEGKSKVKWPNGKHNQMRGGKPCSEAIDLFRLSSCGLVGTWPPLWFAEIADKCACPEILWGGHFNGKFKDAPHFELTELQASDKMA